MSPAQRLTLVAALERSLGQEAADIMMEQLPPEGASPPATQADLALTAAGLRAETQELRAEMHELAAELRSEMHELAAELRSEMQELRVEMRAGFAESRAEMQAMRAEWRGELLAAVQAQTRQLFFGMAGLFATVTALVYAVSRIAPSP